MAYSSYEQRGYRRFLLHDVAFTNGPVRFQAAQVEAWVPTVWLWRAFVSKPSRLRPFASMQNWSLEVAKGADGSPGTNSVSVTAERILAIFDVLIKWAPAAIGSNGVVRLPGGAFQIRSIIWSPAGLAGELRSADGAQDLLVNARPGKGKVTKIQLRSDSLKLQSSINLTLNPIGLNLQSRHLWWSNRIDLQAQFGRSGFLPDKAGLQVPGFQIPGAQLGFAGYPEITGSLLSKWERDHFDLTLNAAAQPESGQTNVPPLKIDLRARGDTNYAIIKSAKIASDFVSAELSEDLNVYFSKPYLRSPGFFRVSADLAKQPWLPAQGTIDGEAQFTTSSGIWPDVQFQFSGFNVGRDNFAAEALKLDGTLHWPQLEVTRAGAIFEDGSFVEAKSSIDLEKREVLSGTVEFGGTLANRWLPRGYRFDSAALTGSFHGPFNGLIHGGHLQVTNFASPALQTLQLGLAWEGKAGSVQQYTLALAATNSSLRSSGSLECKPGAVSMTMNSIILASPEEPLIQLAQPLDIRFQRAASTWHFETSELHLIGKAGEIHGITKIDWPANGRFETSISNVHSESLRGFLPVGTNSFDLQSWHAEGGWTNGPLSLTTELHGSAIVGGEPVSANLQLAAGPAGILISNVNILRQTSSVATASGRVPLTIHPGEGTNSLQMDMSAPLELHLYTDPNSALWERLSDLAGVILSDPKFNVSLGGTWAAPEGDVNLSAEAIKLGNLREGLPKFEKLRLYLHFDRGLARIAEGQILVQGQPIVLSGELPLGEDFWSGLWNRKLPDLEKANAHIQVQQAEISAFAALIPQVLSPQGVFSLDLRVLPGAHLEGEVKVEKARTRPLGNLGPIRDIDVAMRVKDRIIVLENASADVGGSTLTATGTADLRGTNWFAGLVPPFQVLVQGTNVPLARQPESIIRSDLELSITKTNENPAVISGKANLRDSFYLRDVADLLPGGVSSPARRPPYFSIELMPLANWRLAVHVIGNRSLKVRSTLFNGEISANVQLEGTLKDPLAFGDMRIDSGLIRFPFATLDVKQGFVTLTSADPYRPRLQISAGSKKFGYELKMDATGAADAPVLQFTSTPPLSSEQIVLMVTAGELPKGSFTLTPQQKAQTVAVFVGRDLLAKFGLGDDSEDRLTFQSGEQISEQGRPTYGMEYKLNKRWSLVGEYDRFNAFNAGVKWRVYSK